MADAYWKGRDAHFFGDHIYSHGFERNSRDERDFEDGFRAAEYQAEEEREERIAAERARVEEQERVEAQWEYEAQLQEEEDTEDTDAADPATGE